MHTYFPFCKGSGNFRRSFNKGKGRGKGKGKGAKRQWDPYMTETQPPKKHRFGKAQGKGGDQQANFLRSLQEALKA